MAISQDGKTGYALLNQNNTLATIDLTQSPPVLGAQIRVGNAPHSIVMEANLAYITNEGGRAATKNDFTVLSSGTPIVANTQNGSAVTGTVSVYNTVNKTVVATIPVGPAPDRARDLWVQPAGRQHV